MSWVSQYHVSCDIEGCETAEASEPGCPLRAFQHDLETDGWVFDYEMESNIDDGDLDEGSCGAKCPEHRPIRITLDNLDDRDGCVLITTPDKAAAVFDQSIAGAQWEAPEDMDIAYAMPSDSPTLLAELEAEGYIIADYTGYTPPEETTET